MGPLGLSLLEARALLSSLSGGFKTVLSPGCRLPPKGFGLQSLFLDSSLPSRLGRVSHQLF